VKLMQNFILGIGACAKAAPKEKQNSSSGEEGYLTGLRCRRAIPRLRRQLAKKDSTQEAGLSGGGRRKGYARRPRQSTRFGQRQAGSKGSLASQKEWGSEHLAVARNTNTLRKKGVDAIGSVRGAESNGNWKRGGKKYGRRRESRHN